MCCLETVESMTLHYTRKTFTDRRSSHIDVLTRDKVTRAQCRSNRQERIFCHPKLLDLAFRGQSHPDKLSNVGSLHSFRVRVVGRAELQRMEMRLG